MMLLCDKCGKDTRHKWDSYINKFVCWHETHYTKGETKIPPVKSVKGE